MADDVTTEESTEQSDDASAKESGAADDKGEVRDPEAVAAKNKELLDELKASRERLGKYEADEEERRKGALSEAEAAVETAEQVGYQRAEGVYKSLLAEQRVLTAATGVFADPADAVLNIDLDEIDLDDEDAIEAAFTDILKRKPHLALQQKSGGLKQGPRGAVQTQDGDSWLRGVLGG